MVVSDRVESLKRAYIDARMAEDGLKPDCCAAPDVQEYFKQSPGAFLASLGYLIKCGNCEQCTRPVYFDGPSKTKSEKQAKEMVKKAWNKGRRFP